jgi:hypothetical protein
MTWLDFLLPFIGLAGVVVTAVLSFRGKRGETDVAAAAQATTEISTRFDDASELSKYIREEIAREVERQVAPMREKVELMQRESHEMNDAVRARETQLYLWNYRGRPGDLPMLPVPILHRLGLGHMVPDELLGDTIQTTKE